EPMLSQTCYISSDNCCISSFNSFFLPFFFFMPLRPPRSTLFPYTTLFRSHLHVLQRDAHAEGHGHPVARARVGVRRADKRLRVRSEEHTSELQSPCNLVCRLLLEKKKHAKAKEPHVGLRLFRTLLVVRANH